LNKRSSKRFDEYTKESKKNLLKTVLVIIKKRNFKGLCSKRKYNPNIKFGGNKKAPSTFMKGRENYKYRSYYTKNRIDSTLLFSLFYGASKTFLRGLSRRFRINSS